MSDEKNLISQKKKMLYLYSTPFPECIIEFNSCSITKLAMIYSIWNWLAQVVANCVSTRKCLY